MALVALGVVGNEVPSGGDQSGRLYGQGVIYLHLSLNESTPISKRQWKGVWVRQKSKGGQLEWSRWFSLEIFELCDAEWVWGKHLMEGSEHEAVQILCTFSHVRKTCSFNTMLKCESNRKGTDTRLLEHSITSFFERSIYWHDGITVYSAFLRTFYWIICSEKCTYHNYTTW